MPEVVSDSETMQFSYSGCDLNVHTSIGGSREGPGGHVPPLDNWSVPLLHGFHRRIQRRAYWGHVPPRLYWTAPLLRGF